MKRIYRGWCLTGLLLLCIASVAVAAEHTWTGIISDNMCGGSHAGMMAAHPDAKMTAHDCTNACVKAGAKYVFLATARHITSPIRISGTCRYTPVMLLS